MDSIDTLSRGKQSAMVDVKKEEGVHVVRRLCRNADVLLEPYRPGVLALEHRHMNFIIYIQDCICT